LGSEAYGAGWIFEWDHHLRDLRIWLPHSLGEEKTEEGFYSVKGLHPYSGGDGRPREGKKGFWDSI